MAAVPWQAKLELEFTRRGAHTVLTRNRHQGPLQVQKALYPEGRETCHIAVLHPPGGIAAGDTLRVHAALEAGAHALLTTPGASKWYRSEGESARQALAFSLGEQGALEWLPRENIVFDGADLVLDLEVELAPGAHYVGWDILSFGRRASGEAWRRGRLKMQSRIRINGRVLWAEVANIDAAGGFAASPMGLNGMTVCGTMLMAGVEPSALLAACRSVAVPRPASVGITQLPHLVVARYLGDATEAAFAWFTALWAASRPTVFGKTAQPPRVWAC
jgi:urease accessory protein